MERLLTGSKPTHLIRALTQPEQAGSLWSHRFLRDRQRLQALTLRKLEVLVGAAPAEDSSFKPAEWSVGDTLSEYLTCSSVSLARFRVALGPSPPACAWSSVDVDADAVGGGEVGVGLMTCRVASHAEADDSRLWMDYCRTKCLEWRNVKGIQIRS